MAKYVTLTPAYGRDYKSAKAAKADYEAGKDFILNASGDLWSGKPINKAQVEEAGYKVLIRYNKMQRITDL